MFRWLPLALAFASVACSPAPEPETAAAPASEVGVCWRLRAVPGQAPVREVLDRGIDNLQTCATRLEAVRMMEGAAVEGAFEGRLIFVSEAELTQAASRKGKRYPVFNTGQRRAVQAAIQTLLDRKAEQAGRRP